MIKVSFVIPVWNGEKEVEAVMQSIFAQAYQNWEVVFINDGSTDQTAEKLEKLQASDRRIQVIHTPNQGQGLARNIGITAANGDYIWFVDVDDLLLPNALQCMVDLAMQGNYDVICGTYIRNIKEKQILVNHKLEEGILNRFGSEDEIRRYHYFKTLSGFGYLWNKLYKVQFLKENFLEFNDIKQIFMEDQLFNLKVIACNPVFYITAIPVYHYFIHENSTTHKLDEDAIQKNTKLIHTYYAWLQDTMKLDENIDLLAGLAMRVLSWSLIRNMKYKIIPFHQIKHQIQYFVDDEAVQAVINHTNSIESFSFIRSKVQAVGFSVLLLLLRNKQNTVVASLFYVFSPFLRFYANLVVK